MLDAIASWWASFSHDFYRNFAAAIDGGTTQAVTHDQMRRVMKVMEAAFASVEAGQVLSVDL